MFRINGDIYDAKNEKHCVNIKWSVAWKTKSQHAFGPFFAIIRAIMDEIEKIFRELFRIKGDI